MWIYIWVCPMYVLKFANRNCRWSNWFGVCFLFLSLLSHFGRRYNILANFHDTFAQPVFTATGCYVSELSEIVMFVFCIVFPDEYFYFSLYFSFIFLYQYAFSLILCIWKSSAPPFYDNFDVCDLCGMTVYSSHSYIYYVRVMCMCVFNVQIFSLNAVLLCLSHYYTVCFFRFAHWYSMYTVCIHQSAQNNKMSIMPARFPACHPVCFAYLFVIRNAIRSFVRSMTMIPVYFTFISKLYYIFCIHEMMMIYLYRGDRWTFKCFMHEHGT